MRIVKPNLPLGVFTVVPTEPVGTTKGRIGATAGAAVAGPIGAVVGGIVGGLFSNTRPNKKMNKRNSFIDNVFREMIEEPAIGSVLVCDLAFALDHTGIYIGDGLIVHRTGDRDGKIEMVCPEDFLNRLDGLNMAMSIYVACRDKTPFGGKEIAERAEDACFDRDFEGYSLITKNCHNFTRYCLTGETDKDQWIFDFTFDSLERLLENKFDCDTWRVWHRK